MQLDVNFIWLATQARKKEVNEESEATNHKTEKEEMNGVFWFGN